VRAPHRRTGIPRAARVGGLLACVVALSSLGTTATQASDAGGRRAPAVPVTVAAAGDIACDPTNPAFHDGVGAGSWCRAAQTHKVIAALDPDAVLALGDEQYDDGRLAAFRRSYALGWGKERWRTYAVPGNHEYWGSSTAAGYFDYFGAHAGPTRHGWYSSRIGAWRVVALNSNCDRFSCSKGSPEYRWLRRELAAHPATCSLAILHHPLVSSGPHGDDESGARPLWTLLYRAGVDLALAGHDHIYERFAPLRPDGTKDPSHGIREFVVGTGGAQHYSIAHVHRYSQARNTTAFGVLKLALRPGRFAWRFLPAGGATFTDTGSNTCHGAPAR